MRTRRMKKRGEQTTTTTMTTKRRSTIRDQHTTADGRSIVADGEINIFVSVLCRPFNDRFRLGRRIPRPCPVGISEKRSVCKNKKNPMSDHHSTNSCMYNVKTRLLHMLLPLRSDGTSAERAKPCFREKLSRAYI